MKIKILVAFIATATIIFLSCNWFQSKKKQAANPLLGEWKIDSIGFGKDTSKANLFSIAIVQDSSDVNVSITKDSIFTVSPNNVVDTVAYSFDAKTNQLTAKDSSGQVLTYARLNDSLISLATNDSAILYLKRK